jgi:lysyl-tRNA synthetase class I
MNTAVNPPEDSCFRGDRDLTHACVAAELLTSAFESRDAKANAFEDSSGKTKEKRRDFFETFYGAFLGEEANSFTRALHFLRSVSAERATLRVSQALGLAEATEGHEP